MSSSVFVPEILLAGLLSVVAGIIVLVELSVVSSSDLQDVDATFAIPALLAISYLVGLSFKHLSHDHPSLRWLVVENRMIYRDRLVNRWPFFTRQMIKNWSEPDDQIDAELPLADVPAEHYRTLVSRLRLYQLSKYEAPYAEHLNYQWNLARLAKNIIPPMGFFFIACLVAVVVNLFESSLKTAFGFCLLAMLSAILILGLRRVHVDRSCYHLDALVKASQANGR